MMQISLSEQIKCVEREIQKRKWVYPNLVLAGKMTQGTKDKEIAVKALEDIKSYAPSCFNKDDCPLFNENCGCISEGGCFALASYLALAKIKEVEE